MLEYEGILGIPRTLFYTITDPRRQRIEKANSTEGDDRSLQSYLNIISMMMAWASVVMVKAAS